MPNVRLMGVNTSEGLMKTVMNMGIVELSETLEVNHEVTVDGMPASKVVGTMQDDDGIDVARLISYFIVDKDMSYSITFTTPPTDYESYIPIIQKVVDSFKII